MQVSVGELSVYLVVWCGVVWRGVAWRGGLRAHLRQGGEQGLRLHQAVHAEHQRPAQLPAAATAAILQDAQ